ncbi:MAG: hypothetical protein MZV70_51475 [Desulfobacterales bacterium]|nr:hypothetical protein [Desulfobacterales bacterium]
MPEDDLKVIVVVLLGHGPHRQQGPGGLRHGQRGAEQAGVGGIAGAGRAAGSCPSTGAPGNAAWSRPRIKREFERQGVTLLPAADGAHSLLRELAAPAGAPVEVVIGGTLNPAHRSKAVTQKSQIRVWRCCSSVKSTSSPTRCSASHVIDGKAGGAAWR